MKGPLTFLVFAVLWGSVASAELGLAPLKDSHQVKFSAHLKSSTQEAASGGDYTVHESVVGLTTIDEYVNSSGTVFAVTWQGHKQIIPETILGSAYSSDVKKAKDDFRGQRQLAVRTTRLHMSMMGHTRDFRGHACDPTLAPSGVNCEELP